jgi:hypothetical protein
MLVLVLVRVVYCVSAKFSLEPNFLSVSQRRRCHRRCHRRCQRRSRLTLPASWR